VLAGSRNVLGGFACNVLAGSRNVLGGFACNVLGGFACNVLGGCACNVLGGFASNVLGGCACNVLGGFCNVLGVIVNVLSGSRTVLVHAELCRGQARAQHAIGVHVRVAERKAPESPAQIVERQAGVEQGAERHVAGDAGKTVEIQHAH
jgi:hypothetical protein